VSSLPPGPAASPVAGVDLAGQVAALQAEVVAIKTETAVKVASLEDTIANLAHENTLLKRRLYGNRTERSGTSCPRGPEAPRRGYCGKSPPRGDPRCGS
jgi:hypothetical protein